MVLTYSAPDKWVKVVGERSDGSKIYHAGPKSKKYDEGQIVSQQYADSVLGAVTFRNKAAGLVSNIEDIEPPERTERQQEILDGGYSEAVQAQSEFIQLQKQMNKAQQRDDSEAIEDIERDIKDLKGSLGS